MNKSNRKICLFYLKGRIIKREGEQSLSNCQLTPWLAAMAGDRARSQELPLVLVGVHRLRTPAAAFLGTLTELD